MPLLSVEGDAAVVKDSLQSVMDSKRNFKLTHYRQSPVLLAGPCPAIAAIGRQTTP